MYSVFVFRQPDHFSSPSTSSSSSNPLNELKRIYYQLITCPSCSLATHLPVPDLEIISRAANANPSSSTSTSSKAGEYKSELVNLLRIVLLVQTVWSTQNAGVIGVITELGVDEQKVLKEMIEAVSFGKVLESVAQVCELLSMLVLRDIGIVCHSFTGNEFARSRRRAVSPASIPLGFSYRET